MVIEKPIPFSALSIIWGLRQAYDRDHQSQLDLETSSCLSPLGSSTGILHCRIPVRPWLFNVELHHFRGKDFQSVGCCILLISITSPLPTWTTDLSSLDEAAAAAAGFLSYPVHCRAIAVIRAGHSSRSVSQPAISGQSTPVCYMAKLDVHTPSRWGVLTQIMMTGHAQLSRHRLQQPDQIITPSCLTSVNIKYRGPTSGLGSDLNT